MVMTRAMPRLHIMKFYAFAFNKLRITDLCTCDSFTIYSKIQFMVRKKILGSIFHRGHQRNGCGGVRFALEKEVTGEAACLRFTS